MIESPGGQAFLQKVTGDVVGVALGGTGATGLGRLLERWQASAGLGSRSRPLQDFELDYVARKDDAIIIGEVKSRSPKSLQTLDQTLNRLARAVAKVPNARLEVHWLGDIAATASVAPLIHVDSADVQSQIDETRILLRLHHVRPAVLIAWSAVEGALIYHAAQLDMPLPDDARAARSPWQLLSYLDSLGYINEADLKRLTELRNQRNAVAHFSGRGALADPGGHRVRSELRRADTEWPVRLSRPDDRLVRRASRRCRSPGSVRRGRLPARCSGGTSPA